MNYLAFYGLRGGTGTTSIVAALGYALHRQGQRVLLADLGGEGMLGLHLNCPVASLGVEEGWQYWEAAPGLDVLAFSSRQTDVCLNGDTESRQDFLQLITGKYDVLLFDLAGVGQADSLGSLLPCLHRFVVTPVDAAAHVRLHTAHGRDPLLLNRFLPESRLQNDLRTLWLHDPRLKVLPVVLHHDEAWNEALAHKQPVGLIRANSLAAREMDSLAIWCMALAER